MGAGISSKQKDIKTHPYLAYIHQYKARSNPFGPVHDEYVHDRDILSRRNSESILSRRVKDCIVHPTQYRSLQGGLAPAAAPRSSCHSLQTDVDNGRLPPLSAQTDSRATSAVSTRTFLSDPGTLSRVQTESEGLPWYMALSSNQNRFNPKSLLQIAQANRTHLELMPVEVAVLMKRDQIVHRPHSCPVPGASKNGHKWRSALPPKPHSVKELPLADKMPTTNQIGPMPQQENENLGYGVTTPLPGEELESLTEVPSAAIY